MAIVLGCGSFAITIAYNLRFSPQALHNAAVYAGGGADSVGRQLAMAWLTGIAASLVGLGVSYIWDLPTGSAMVCAFGAALALAGLA